MFNNAQELIFWIESQKRLTPKVSLDRFRKICEVYGSPEKNIKYIHVGGTNGKGSTVTYIKNILRQAEYNVGGYISPYVIAFNERISYNDNYISDDDLLEIGNYIISKYDILAAKNLEKPSFFEFVTIMAFIYFSRIKDLDFVVLEVGLGGLLDATNIVTPILSIITNIAFDHMNVLGNTLPEIAKNKLGIVKHQVPLITIKNSEILDLVKATTTNLQSPLILVDKNSIKNIRLSLQDTVFDYLNYRNIQLKMLGSHQTENAALAIEAICLLRDKYGYDIPDETIYQGLANTTWPGRLQVISKKPMMIIDGAHNIDGITRLTEFLRAIKGNKKIKLIFAVSADKAKEEMIKLIEQVADEIIFTRFNYKRSDTANHLLELSHHQNKRIEEDLDKIIVEVKQETDKIIVFCGSLYFVSEIFKKI